MTQLALRLAVSCVHHALHIPKSCVQHTQKLRLTGKINGTKKKSSAGLTYRYNKVRNKNYNANS